MKIISENQKLKHLKLVHELNYKLSGIYDLQEILEKTVLMISKELKCKRCSILIFNDSSDNAIIKAAVGLENGKNISSGIVIEKIGKITSKIQKTGKAILKKKKKKENGFENISFLAVPIISENKVLGIVSLTEKINYHDFNVSEKKLVQTLATTIAIVLRNFYLHSEIIKNERHIKEFEIANDIQCSLIPKTIPKIKELDIKYLYSPAYEVGGDYFDVFEVDNKIIITIGDVAGKGIRAAFIMTMLRSFVRSECRNNSEISKIMQNLNFHFYELLKDSYQFVTLFLSIYDKETNELEFSNAGHDYPIIISDNNIKFLEKGGLFFGELKEVDYNIGKIKLKENDRLFLYTDGVTDQRNKNCEHYGMERLEKIINRYSDNLENIIFEDIKKFCGDVPQFDDITILNIRIKS